MEQYRISCVPAHSIYILYQSLLLQRVISIPLPHGSSSKPYQWSEFIAGNCTSNTHTLTLSGCVSALLQAHEMGTPLSASFEGFGADEKGRVSAQQLHVALKDIGQFRWTTVRLS